MADKVKYKFKHSVVGGTFDRLHKGHEFLLFQGFSKSEKVTIGLSSNEFASQRLKFLVEDYEIRFKKLVDFLRKNDFLLRSTIIKIDDVFGTTLGDTTIDSIIVTKETIGGAVVINTERAKRGLEGLKVETVPLITGQKKRVITSTNIRLGLTDRKGLDYFLKIGANKFILPDEIRLRISKPQGKIISEKELNQFSYSLYSRVICVGDIITKTFIKLGLRFDLAVVDLKTNRDSLFISLSDLGIINPLKLTVVNNKRGTVSQALTRAIKNSMQGNIDSTIIQVIGEEDLAVIPAVILAPLGSLIFYGQRNQGIVYIEVDEKTKEKFLKILDLFEKVKN